MCVVALLVLPAAAAGAQGQGEGQIRRALEQVVDGVGGPPGAAAVLRRGGKERLITVGVADVESKRRFAIDKYMRIASVSKAFSGAVALALVDRGELSLDDTVGERLPGLAPKWDAVTLRQLLSHTGGVPSYTKDLAFQMYFGTHLQDQISIPALLAYVTGKDLDFTPGTDYEYSNTDNILISLFAEAATGETYNALLRELVFEPLGLHRTRLPGGFDLPTPLIHGYELNPLEDVSECCSMSFVRASGGMYSTPHELTRFVRGYVSGELFGGSARRQQFRFVRGGSSEPPGPGRNSAGLALFRYQTSCGTMFGHSGNFPGYTQFTATTRNGKRSVTVSVNRQLAPDALSADAREAFVRLRHAYRVAVCSALRD